MMHANSLRAAMATVVRAFSSVGGCPVGPADRGVSIAQGASRGVGLEFVSATTLTQPQLAFYFSFLLLSPFPPLLPISDSLIDPLSVRSAVRMSFCPQTGSNLGELCGRPDRCHASI